MTREIGRYTRLKGEMEGWERLRGDALGALELLQDLLVGSSGGDNFEEDEDEMILLTFEECQSSAQKLLEQSQKYELQTLLSAAYDSAQCTLQLTAGAGGTEACDWVSMLYRMYMRHAQFMDYKVTVLEESVGDVVGWCRGCFGDVLGVFWNIIFQKQMTRNFILWRGGDGGNLQGPISGFILGW